MENEILTSKKTPLKFSKPTGSRMAYKVFGTGPEYMLCFHGYGLDKECYYPFSILMGSRYRLVSIDLLFHGDTVWDYENPLLSAQELKEHIQNILNAEQITSFGIIGFSMGGKVALKICEQFREAVHTLVLIAPDGIKTRFWYNLATYPVFFSGLFRHIVYHPNVYYSLLKFFHALGLVEKGLLKFATQEMNTFEKRRRVYCSWMAYKNIRARPDELIDLLNRLPIRLICVGGSFDKIVPSRYIRKFSAKVAGSMFCNIPVGHSNLLKHVAQAKYLQHMQLM